MKIADDRLDLPVSGTDSTAALLRELVAHLRQHRTELREEWARRITQAKLLSASEYTYNAQHPYTSVIPIVVWILLRNATPLFRGKVLHLFSWY